MNTIIDGYNLIFQLGWLAKSQHALALEKSRLRLIRELASRIPLQIRADITIVFDAKSTPIKDTACESKVNGFRVVFADQFDEADTLIEEMIRTHAAPKSLTVVSNDNRLKVAARRRRATAINVEQWLDQISKSKLENFNSLNSDASTAKERAIQDMKDTDWMAEFNLGHEEIENFVSNQIVSEADFKSIDAPDPKNPFPPHFGEDLSE